MTQPSSDTSTPDGAPTPDGTPTWQRRFHATRHSLPRWALLADHRTAYTTNATGVRQVWSWDLRTDRHTPITASPAGVRGGAPSPDGQTIVWFDDDGGSEVGRFVATPFDGGASRPLAPGVDDGWSTGLSMRPQRSAVGTADADGFAITIVEGDDARTILRQDGQLYVGGLSADSALLALSHADHGDVLHPSVRVVSPDGQPRGEAYDGPGHTVSPAGWSPVAGDPRLALVVERNGRRAVDVWHVAEDRRIPCELDVEGDLEVEDWWPDGSALLVAQQHRGRRRLWRYDLASDTAVTIDTGDGTVSAAAVRPDGQLWYVRESSAHPPTVMQASTVRAQPLLTSTDPAPPGSSAVSIDYATPDGGSVHAWLTLPAGDAPYPLLIDVHGGPHAQVGDEFDPFVQAWVDHGFAVLAPNYRGSSGYGTAWHDALEGDPGRPEIVDIVAGRDHLVTQGLADPDRIVLSGASWGGYLALMGIGTVPDRWSAAVATVPVADYETAYADESPGLQEFDRGLFGGTPQDQPDLYRERSPLTYADQVRVPVLVITGANDTRCPRRQVDNYVEALERHGVVHAYDVFDAGHGSLAAAENVRQQALALDFAAEHLGTSPAER